MNNSGKTQVKRYLKQLRLELRDVSTARREETVAEIEAHIEEEKGHSRSS